jgi:hypothetical protein
MEPSKKRDEPIINKWMYFSIIWCGIYSAILSIFFLKSNFINSTFVSTATKVQMYFRRNSGAKFKPVNVFNIDEQNKS